MSRDGFINLGMAKRRGDLNSADGATRLAVLDLLKRRGPTDAKELAAQLGRTTMAIRLHLYGLRDEGLLEGLTEHRPVGRPATLWRLTREADRLFPDRHADLAAGSLAAAEQVFGSEGLEKMLAQLGDSRAAGYREQMPRGASLEQRVQILADLRTREGYMAEVQAQDDGSLLLLENHCPICVGASSCGLLCALEATVFQQVLGPRAHIERTEHVQAGARRCAYRIRRRRRAEPTAGDPR